MEIPQKKKNTKQQDNSDHDSDDEQDDYIEEAQLQKKKQTKIPRQSVSAEVYGMYNPKGNYVPKVVNKSEQSYNAIKLRLEQAFMFSALDQTDRKIVIDAMEEVNYKAGDWVIRQGEDGQVLYVVDQGQLKCFKKFGQGEQDTYLKTYYPGESFGELALLYNAPRAASIQAETNCKLFSLDRECFNHIVRDAASKKREKYEKFLQSLELLSEMDPYDRITISDALQEQSFQAGEQIIRQGDAGNTFFFLESGTAKAQKVLNQGGQPVDVYQYNAGDYFGEIALINGGPRTASVVATSNCSVVSLEKSSFQLLLGQLTDKLKSNFKRYKNL